MLSDVCNLPSVTPGASASAAIMSFDCVEETLGLLTLSLAVPSAMSDRGTGAARENTLRNAVRKLPSATLGVSASAVNS